MAEVKVKDYFMKKHMNDYAFIQLTPQFIGQLGLDFMKNVPVPIKKSVLGGFATDKTIKMENFVMAMVMVIGMDPDFKYTGMYLAFLRHVNKDIFDAVMTVGVEFANDGNYEMAAIHFRAACKINDTSLAPQYNYMLACRQMYSESEDKAFVAAFKTEVNQTLELITQKHSDFAMGFYYLGFSYINAGLYSRAKETWESFMKKSEPEKADGDKEPAKVRFAEERQEIAERIAQLEEPVKIEAAYTDIMAGTIEPGMKVLEGYINTKYMDWWPLPYYLGIGYSRTDRYQEAIEMFKKVLEKEPSNPETMAELTRAYRKIGDEENALKYEKKFELLSREDD